VTIPALLLIYPMAIMLVVLQLVRNKLPSIRLSYYVTIFVTVCFSLVDSLKNLDVLPEGLHQVMIHFPLYSQGLAWLVPALCTLVLSILLGKTISK
jgi:LIVCS family branched-chain amino acid:cation transporter